MLLSMCKKLDSQSIAAQNKQIIKAIEALYEVASNVMFKAMGEPKEYNIDGESLLDRFVDAVFEAEARLDTKQFRTLVIKNAPYILDPQKIRYQLAADNGEDLWSKIV